MRTVTQRIQAFNQGKDIGLLHLKYKAMRTDVFAFFRGTCHLFYEDWPTISPMNNAPPVWICGDIHMQNFGMYKANNRLVYFGLNDFDESLLAPYTWDLARFQTGLFVSAPMLHLDEGEATMLCQEFLHAYTDSLVHNQVTIFDQDTARGAIKKLLTHLSTRKRKDLLQARTHILPDGERKLYSHDEQMGVEKVTKEQRAEIGELIERWKWQQPHPQFFTLLDMAHRIAGIGSLGGERYVLLVAGKGSPDQNYLLDLKEACPSSLSPYLNDTQPRWKSEAERIVTIQSWSQEASPAYLAAIDSNTKSYLLRELQPKEDKIKLEAFKGKKQQLKDLVNTMGKVLASGHLRSSREHGITTADQLCIFAQAAHWQHAVLKYAQMYAIQVHENYRSFCDNPI